MKYDLPYLYIDDEFDFNTTILLLIIDKLALNSKKNYKLDFNKLQFFMYLVKNPSKINKILDIAGKKCVHIDESQIYTVESLSLNVDILYDRLKVKSLLRELAATGMLSIVNDEKNGISYELSDKGKELALELKSGYFVKVSNYIDNVKSLQSLPSSKLFSILNLYFKGK